MSDAVNVPSRTAVGNTKQVRSFSVVPKRETELYEIGELLDRELLRLQSKHWEIIDVQKVKCRIKNPANAEWFKGVSFVIIAQKNLLSGKESNNE